MTHEPETCAINRLQKSSSDFWFMFHANMLSVSSSTRFWHQWEYCSILFQTRSWHVRDWNDDLL